MESLRLLNKIIYFGTTKQIREIVITNVSVVRKLVTLLCCSSNSDVIISTSILTLAKIIDDRQRELHNPVTEENVIAPLLNLITKSNSVVN